MLATIEDAITAYKNGEMLIIVDDEDRENEGDLVIAAQHATPEAINFMAKEGRGLICAPVSEAMAKRLHFHAMVGNADGDTNFTVSVDAKDGVTTGISAADRARTIAAILDENSGPRDFRRPGHIFPLNAKKGGVLKRAGHTEAAVDLAQLAGLKPAGVICEIMNDDGTMARLPDLEVFAKKHGLMIISIADLIKYRCGQDKLIDFIAKAPIPTEHGEFMMHVYESKTDGKEHVAMVYGDISSGEEVLVRAHSECLTGDLFGSERCDCGPQLETAKAQIVKRGAGVLLYMRDEGRGIGLGNKIKAYGLQDEGLDTIQANEKLGFKMDLREYGIGAQILCDLGIKSLELLTNNPKKIVGLEGHGLRISKRIPIESTPKLKNIKYLKTKKERMGHMLDQV